MKRANDLKEKELSRQRREKIKRPKLCLPAVRQGCVEFSGYRGSEPAYAGECVKVPEGGIGLRFFS